MGSILIVFTGLVETDEITRWRHEKQLSGRKLIVLFLILLIVFVISFDFGRYEGIALIDVVKVFMHQIIPIEQTWPDMYQTVVMYVRFPRIFSAIMIGMALSVSGNAYQTVFKNPLVAPDILGASSGASLGAAVAIFVGLGAPWIQIFAFAGAMLAVWLACTVSTKVKRDPTLALVLGGVTEVQVLKKPVVGILPIGENLIYPGKEPKAGETIECNSVYLAAFAKMCHAEAHIYPIISDGLEDISKMLKKAMDECDIIATIGGVGRGQETYADCTLNALAKHTRLSTIGLKVGPGGKNMVLAGAGEIVFGNQDLP
ncbi:MAG: iron chelate uptake ABC transporter family permease subunit [Lachnospiraceae bacterium]|nr:iron chelate uptake ABC transporter family permease subunit [Lachnospiraceae bacterium]